MSPQQPHNSESGTQTSKTRIRRTNIAAGRSMFIAMTDRSIEASVVFFQFCAQQTKTEFAFCKTKLTLNFNTVFVVLVFGFHISFPVLRSAESFARNPDAMFFTEIQICPVSVDPVNKNPLRIIALLT